MMYKRIYLQCYHDRALVQGLDNSDYVVCTLLPELLSRILKDCLNLRLWGRGLDTYAPSVNHQAIRASK